jgi:hypothetical protein
MRLVRRFGGESAATGSSVPASSRKQSIATSLASAVRDCASTSAVA